jgi:hypothetical protein
MAETWLRPNRRAIWFGCVPPLAVALLGGWIVFRATGQGSDLSQWLGAVLVVMGFGIIVMLLRQLRRPRIAYRDGQVLFYLRSGSPIAVPASIVEAFFLGQGAAMLPGGRQVKHQSVNLVARLSQREIEWARRDVKPALGQWCEGYLTVRGTWCEPLRGNLIRRLNHRLAEVKTTGGADA